MTTYISKVSPHPQHRLTHVNLEWPFEQVRMGAGIAPQDHTSYVASKALPLIGLIAAKKEGSAGLHEGAVEIP